MTADQTQETFYPKRDCSEIFLSSYGSKLR